MNKTTLSRLLQTVQRTAFKGLGAASFLSLLLLTACGGAGSGAKVEAGTPPATSGGETFTYKGQKPASTADITKFQNELWLNIAPQNRCGSCHTTQAPAFARGDDINIAYNLVIENGLVALSDPAQSRLVTKVASGHNCWLADPVACGDIMAGWITKWAGPSSTSANDVTLKAPADKEIANSKSLPPDSSSFKTTVYPLLNQYCSRCHSENAVTKQQPYFASSDVDAAYQAAKSKLRLDNPGASRLVQRLRTDSHNCWGDCAANASEMQQKITEFADGIPVVNVDKELVISKAVGLGDAFVLTSGGRIDSDIIAKYEFKQGKGTVAFDTSGIEPAANLNLIGNVGWSSAWGIKFADNGRAQAATTGSKKLHDLLRGSGEYTIETWIIPDNVDQGMNDNNPARIVSYSGSTTERNFTLGQYEYNYSLLNRTNTSDANGLKELHTKDNDQRAQASLQHVVATFDPVNGRKIYVNGEFTGDKDPDKSPVLKEWDSSYALTLGNEAGTSSMDYQWKGSVRFVAIHKRAMSLGDIKTNFNVGVGAKYLLLFNISDLVNLGGSYIVFEVQQIDDYGYLFSSPFFTNLNNASPASNIDLQGIRIGVNGVEAPTGQVFAHLDTAISAGSIVSGRQLLSPLGTVVEAKVGPEEDVFFLTFDRIGSHRYARAEPVVPPTAEPADIVGQARLGLRDFAEINASLAVMTGVPATHPTVTATYEKVKQQLPTLTHLEGFLAAHQMGVTQLTVAYCNAAVGDNIGSNNLRDALFPGFNFALPIDSAFTLGTRSLIIEPLLKRLLAHELPLDGAPASALLNQAAPDELRLELNQLIDNMTSCAATNTCETNQTLTTVKATCAAALGSAVMLLQ